MITINQILQAKGSEVWSVSQDATLAEALQLMAEKEIGAVLVMDLDRVVGIFSERDFARHAVVGEGCTLQDTVSTMMTTEVYVISPDQTTEECMALMTRQHFRHLPVMDHGRLVGMITIGDIVKWMIEEKDVAIRGLENYILGRGYQG